MTSVRRSSTLSRMPGSATAFDRWRISSLNRNFSSWSSMAATLASAVDTATPDAYGRGSGPAVAAGRPRSAQPRVRHDRGPLTTFADRASRGPGTAGRSDHRLGERLERLRREAAAAHADTPARAADADPGLRRLALQRRRLHLGHRPVDRPVRQPEPLAHRPRQWPARRSTSSCCRFVHPFRLLDLTDDATTVDGMPRGITPEHRPVLHRAAASA